MPDLSAGLLARRQVRIDDGPPQAGDAGGQQCRQTGARRGGIQLLTTCDASCVARCIRHQTERNPLYTTLFTDLPSHSYDRSPFLRKDGDSHTRTHTHHVKSHNCSHLSSVCSQLYTLAVRPDRSERKVPYSGPARWRRPPVWYYGMDSSVRLH